MSATLMPARGRRAVAGLAAAAVLSGLVATVTIHPTEDAVAAEATASLPPLIASDATWRYLENDTFPSAGATDPLSWTAAGFDDSQWKSGVGTFGGKIASGVQSPVYDSSHTASVPLEMNGATGERVRAYFFRHSFTLTAAQLAQIRGGEASFEIDDSAMVYLNGREVVRHEVKAGSEGLNYAPDGSSSLDTVPVALSADDLKVGVNVLAVSVHNDRASSSDIWFGPGAVRALSTDAVAARPSRVVLTPTDDPYTSQNITFQGAEEGDTRGRVEIRPTAGGDLKSVRAPLQPASVSNSFGHFSATVTGLRPATSYTYRVSSNGRWSPWFEFETADPSEKEFQYVYYGDAQIGLDTTWPSVVKQAEARAPEAIGSVHAGDLIDTSSNDTQWRNWFAGMEKSAATTNVMAAPGNHEYSGDKLMTAWKAHFEYPLNNPNDSTIGALAELAKGDSPAAAQHRAYFDHWADFAQETVYFADYQGVRFITVNATRDTTFLRPDVVPTYSGEGAVTDVAALWTRYQAAWLDHVLENSEQKWNVVTFHQPVYSTSSGRNEPVLREHWVPVFAKHNIDLVQMGHDHTYARGYTNDDLTAEPGVTDGPVYMVANSGAKHYALETDARNVWTLNGATQVQKAQGLTTYQVVDVSAHALTVRSYVAEVDPSSLKLFRQGVQVDASSVKVGDLWDEFTVHKTDDGRKKVVEAGAPTPDFEDLTPAPVVTRDLVAHTAVTRGERVRLEAAITGAEQLQWQRRLVGGDWRDVDGAHASVLDLGRVHLDELGTGYRLVATAGNKRVLSTETTLVDGTAAPVISTDLAAQTPVEPGKRVTMTIVAKGAEKFQWQVRRGAAGWSDVEGAHGTALALGRVERAELGDAYRVLVTAGTREVVSGATVLTDATRKPVFVTDLPQQLVVASGSDARLQVALDADTPATIQWQRKEAGRWTDWAGRSGNTLLLESVRTGGEYRAVASIGDHVVTSQPVTVTVRRTATSVSAAPLTVRPGRAVRLRVTASAAGVASVKVTAGGRTLRSTVKLTAGRGTVVKLGKLKAKAKGRAKVTVVLTPGVDHTGSRTTRWVRIKK